MRDLWYGKAPQITISNGITGRLNRVTKSKVTKRINAILNSATNAKIGVAGDAIVRIDQDDYRKSYKFVAIIFETSSPDIAADYEVELIKKFQKSHPEIIDNVSTGRAGRLTTYSNRFCIYMVYN